MEPALSGTFVGNELCVSNASLYINGTEWVTFLCIVCFNRVIFQA